MSEEEEEDGGGGGSGWGICSPRRIKNAETLPGLIYPTPAVTAKEMTGPFERSFGFPLSCTMDVGAGVLYHSCAG